MAQIEVWKLLELVKNTWNHIIVFKQRYIIKKEDLKSYNCSQIIWIRIGWLIGLFYGVSTLFRSFNAE